MASVPQTGKNLLLAILMLWSVVAIVIITVWASSYKTPARCMQELQEVTQTLEGEREVWGKNKVALEEMVEEARENQTRLQKEIHRLTSINASLQECLRETVILNGNISALEQQIEQHREIQANLTTNITLQQDHMEALRFNLKSVSHQKVACLSLKAAAESQRLAAESQTLACQSSQQYLNKQLGRCKVSPGQTADSAAWSPSGVPVLVLLVCTGLCLVTCKYNGLH